MSAMYKEEVPAYGTLMELVADVNARVLREDPHLHERLAETDSLERISEERHGAIRLGTAAELSMMRRVFAVMGMFPVGYYDLSAAAVPVHSTAFRPVDDAALKRNPFRVFTSLLRLDLIADEKLRAEAEEVLSKRQIFTTGAIALVEKAEAEGGLGAEDAKIFVDEVLETFRWHDRANVSADLYHRLHDAHRLIADVVSFKGPHINHLTPRTLDIDAVQDQMPERGINPKAVVEGPPTRNCPILLRQTSFKALEEAVSFIDADGTWTPGSHTARFGEIEQRGIALTPKGRALYDRLLSDARAIVRPAPDGSNAAAYMKALDDAFGAFLILGQLFVKRASATSHVRSRMRQHLQASARAPILRFWWKPARFSSIRSLMKTSCRSAPPVYSSPIWVTTTHRNSSKALTRSVSRRIWVRRCSMNSSIMPASNTNPSKPYWPV